MAQPARAFSDSEIREIVRLLHITDMTIADIATRMDCSRSSVAAVNRRSQVRPYAGLVSGGASQNENAGRNISRKVVLVADDEVMLRNLIHPLLHDQGYEVLEAADGNEAVRLSRTHSGTIDLLLTDVDMPSLDGISAYQRISAERADIRVLFMSGAVPESSRVPDGLPFLPKPFGIDALCTKVREVLE